MQMNRLALKAIARLTRVDMKTAAQTIRHNPILDSEITIDEELINLKESMESYHIARQTLRVYPKMRMHYLYERQAIMVHCIGLVQRMLQGRKLQFSYSAADIDRSIGRLIELLLDDARRTGRRIDRDVLDVFAPFMSIRRRVVMRQWGIDMFLPRARG